jgi:hypothetical protein
VHGDVVVIPAQGDQVVGVMGAALGSGHHVVHFEAIAAGASIDDAAAVACENESPHLWRHHPSRRTDRQRNPRVG